MTTMTTPTVVDLRGRQFLTLLDYSKDEIVYLLDLAAELKAAKRAGTEVEHLRKKEICLIFEKTSTRTRCSFEVAAYDQGAHVTYLGSAVLADGPQGDDQGHGARARPAVRRHRVSRLRPGHRRDAGRLRRRAGLERPHRRVPPDPDPGRHPHHARALPTSRSATSPTHSSATPGTTWATRCSSAARSWAWTSGSSGPAIAGRRRRSSRPPGRSPRRPAPGSPSPTRSRTA